MELNTEQQLAVEYMKTTCLVAACPGSGKTSVLTHRAVRLIQKGVDPSNIICITFTNKAAGEMKERIIKLLGKNASLPYVGTFHAFCVQILRRFGPILGYTYNFSVADQTDQTDVIFQIARRLGYDKLERSDAYVVANAVNNFRESMEEDDGDLEDRLEGKKFLLKVAIQYLKDIKSQNIIDFSGLLSETAELLKGYPEVLERVQNKIQYVLLDECQDTNLVQFFIAEKITAKSKNLFAVFDTDQCVYQWRGARPQNIKDYIGKNPECKIIHLHMNYRSTPQIIKVAEKLIKNNEDRFLERFETINTDGDEPVCTAHKDQLVEAEWVASKIYDLIYVDGYKPGDIAVLYRVNKMSEPIERGLVGKGIKYVVLGNRSFYDRREIRDCLAMLKFVANPKDGIAFHRVASFIAGIGDKTVGAIENIAVEDNISILEACKKIVPISSAKIKSGIDKILSVFEENRDGQSVAQIADDLVSKTGYESFLSRFDPESYEDRRENVKQLIDSAANLSQNGSVDRYLQQVSLFTSMDKEAGEDKVTLMSCHCSKGTEYKIVFILALEHGQFPHGLTLKEDPEGGEASERRLLYVASTRAKRLLFLNYCKARQFFSKYGGNSYKPSRPSRFLFEMGVMGK